MNGVDSEGWTCLGRGVGYIGRRPAGDLCPSCVVEAMTTETEIGHDVADSGLAGPFETAGEAQELPEVRAIYAGWTPRHHLADGARRLLRQALDDAGVSLGAYDQALTAWIAGFEPQVVAVIASWVTRARRHYEKPSHHLRVVRPDAAAPRLVTLDSDQAATVLDALNVAAECKGERVAACPDCPNADDGRCETCTWRLRMAEGYEAVAGHIRGAS